MTKIKIISRYRFLNHSLVLLQFNYLAMIIISDSHLGGKHPFQAVDFEKMVNNVTLHVDVTPACH